MHSRNSLIHLVLSSLFLVGSLAFQFCSRAVGNRNITPASGLYIRTDTSLDGKDFKRVLLFGKRNTVRYIADYLEPTHTLLRHINEYGTKMKYDLKGDSIIFLADSTFMGFRTMEYTAFEVHHLDSFPQYTQGITMEFRGKIYGDTIRFRMVEVSTKISVYNWVHEDEYVLQRNQ